MQMTYDEAKAEVKRVYEEDRDRYIAMREEAARELEAIYREMGATEEGIGSSDVSIKVITMVQYGEMEV